MFTTCVEPTVLSLQSQVGRASLQEVKHICMCSKCVYRSSQGRSSADALAFCSPEHAHMRLRKHAASADASAKACTRKQASCMLRSARALLACESHGRCVRESMHVGAWCIAQRARTRWHACSALMRSHACMQRGARADASAKACTWKHAPCMLSCAPSAPMCMAHSTAILQPVPYRRSASIPHQNVRQGVLRCADPQVPCEPPGTSSHLAYSGTGTRHPFWIESFSDPMEMR